MKFLVDANLPLRLAKWLTNQGYDTLHTLELPEKNNTQDLDIIKLSMTEERIVVSKDSDFYEFFVLKGEPHQLLLISTGNMTNKVLMKLFEDNFQQMITLLETSKVVEVGHENIIVHF